MVEARFYKPGKDVMFGEDFGSDAISLEVPVKSVIEYSYRKGDGTSGCEQIHGWWESQDGGCGLRGFLFAKKEFIEDYADLKSGMQKEQHQQRMNRG